MACTTESPHEGTGAVGDLTSNGAGATGGDNSGATIGSGGVPGLADGGGSTGSGGATNGGDGSGGSFSSGGTSAGGPTPHLLGADITITLEDEHWGATYTDQGTQKPIEQVLEDHGFNAIRIDTFVNPAAPGGYAEDKVENFRDLTHTIVLAQRVKALGMFFLLDLHMSDTWTNPSAQAIPAGWTGYDLSQLEEAVYDYVHNAVQQLIDANAKPDMVQVGNEITNGMLWELGRIQGDDFENFGRLLKAGISAVRAIDPNILVMLHIEKCDDLSTSRWWLDGVLNEGVTFDVLGQSCYAAATIDGDPHHAGYHGSPAEWQTVFDALADEYPELEFVIAEYSAEQRAANDVIRSLPNNRGLGTFNWDPTRFYETHPNVPLFEPDGAWNDYVTVPAQIEKYDQMAIDYGLSP